MSKRQGVWQGSPPARMRKSGFQRSLFFNFSKRGLLGFSSTPVLSQAGTKATCITHRRKAHFETQSRRSLTPLSTRLRL